MARLKTVAGTSADPTIQFATLKVGEESYPLAYSFNSIAEAEHVAGCNLLGGLENLGELSALQFRGLLYAAMKVANPKVTIEQAGELIGFGSTGVIASALAEAYRLSMPVKKQDPPVAEDAPAD